VAQHNVESGGDSQEIEITVSSGVNLRSVVTDFRPEKLDDAHLSYVYQETPGRLQAFELVSF
jgi:hypothetical protein